MIEISLRNYKYLREMIFYHKAEKDYNAMVFNNMQTMDLVRESRRENKIKIGTGKNTLFKVCFTQHISDTDRIPIETINIELGNSLLITFMVVRDNITTHFITERKTHIKHLLKFLSYVEYWYHIERDRYSVVIDGFKL